MDTPIDTAERHRRQRYMQRRSQVKAAMKGGADIVTERMSDDALWSSARHYADEVMRAAEGGSSVEAYGRARRLWLCVEELRGRAERQPLF